MRARFDRGPRERSRPVGCEGSRRRAPAGELDLEPDPTPAPEHNGDPVAAPTTATAPVLDASAVSHELFGTRRTGFETQRIFDEGFRGRRVRGSGTLARIETFVSDVVFGRTPGTRVTLELSELEGEGYGRDVRLVAALAHDRETELRHSRGEEFEVEGTLVRCDPFLRTLFVATD